jgi:penicillin-binding protein 1C
VLDRHGEVLYEARSASGMRGEWIPAAEVPPVVAYATMAAEDRRFRSHAGLDPLAIVRAAWRNVRAGAIVQGGSTITQQVAELLAARRADGRGPRGWRAQLREAVLALRIEHRLTKDEILALYLNLAPYGNQIEGVERAARAYFGVRSAQLTPAQAAFLAALPQQPSRFNPWRDADAARPRQRRILRAMAEQAWLTPRDYETAVAEAPVLTREGTDAIAPHFVERVLADTAGRAPRRILTSLDASLQRTVSGIIAARRADLEAHHAFNVAVAVLDNRSGEWLAWEGSGNYFDAVHGGTIDGVTTPRQPGSALKPFTYAAAFERGLHPGVVLPDVPSQFPTAEPGILYSPRNYDGRFRGPLLARAALAGSENVPAVALASEIGVPAIARLLRRLGLSTLDRNAAHYGLGLTLGNAEVRLDELVTAYAILARGGTGLETRRVRALDDRPLAPSSAGERVLSARTAFWIADVLADSESRAYTFGRGGSLEFPFAVAAKTGTSQAYHDNWAIGYVRDVTVGVWVGNFDRTPLSGSSGVTGAGPIFHDVMIAALQRIRGTLPVGDYTPVLPPTPDTRRASLCAVSGLAPTPFCLRRVTEWVPVEHSPGDCTWHHDSDAGLITLWPERYRQWARDEGLLRQDAAPYGMEVPPAGGAIEDRASGAPAGLVSPAGNGAIADETAVVGLRIVAPLAGATYMIDPTLRPEFQTLPLRAAGAERAAVLRWFVNGTPVGSAVAGETLRWPLARGRHAIVVRDATGREAAARIEVR